MATRTARTKAVVVYMSQEDAKKAAELREAGLSVSTFLLKLFRANVDQALQRGKIVGDQNGR